MNKTAIKNFATWARNKLISDISYKAGLLGITGKGINDPLPQSTQEMQFFDIGTTAPYSITGDEIAQRRRLVEEIRGKEKQGDYATAFRTVVEEVAYTWFNRLIAVRFMEVNDYLPFRIRVLSSESPGKAEPDLVTTPFDADLPFSEKERALVAELKRDNKLDELFRLLFIKQCKELSNVLPVLFNAADNQSILLALSFTDKESVVWHLVNDIAERDFKIRTQADDEAIARGELREEDAPAGQVEIIGWLYQYYNTEPKQEVFDLLKKNVKITKERIPAATQLFTPDWIVRYMVENSLGRLWLERHPNDDLRAKWTYYVDEAEQEPAVAEQLRRMRAETPINSPEDITFIDPCMGSGHILVYAFDVLMQIYESCGYNARDAALLILRRNLHGLDIDKRAYQLAHFSVTMKARQYNRRILSEGGGRGIYLMCFDDAVDINPQLAAQWGNKEFDALLAEFKDVDTYGSLLKIKGKYDLDGMLEVVQAAPRNEQISLMEIPFAHIVGVINLAKMLTQKYDVVCTNPPYMGSSGMNGKLSEFVKKEYPDSKSDLFAAFIERCQAMTRQQCYFAMITQHAWMFLSSFEKLREKLAQIDTVNMAHLGPRAFAEIGGEVVQSTAFVMHTVHVPAYQGVYVRLIDFPDAALKEQEFLSGRNRYTANADNFKKIPGMPVAYWVSERMLSIFADSYFFDYTISDGQNKTGNNDRYLRSHWEVSNLSVGRSEKWFFYAKGGNYRKWYGNITDVIDWSHDAKSHYRKDKIARLIPEYLWYKAGITWSLLSSKIPSFRFLPEDATFDVVGSSIFLKDSSQIDYFLGLLNSKVFLDVVMAINPTLAFQVRDIRSMPVIIMKYGEVSKLTNDTVSISKAEWDSFETSWDFQAHPLIKHKIDSALTLTTYDDSGDQYSQDMRVLGWTINTIGGSYEKYKFETNASFNKLKANEEELNRIFIDIYGLQDELTPDVADKDVTVARIYDSKEDIPESMKGNGYVLTKADVIKSFISYAAGCMFGRYSLDVEGLAYAGGAWDDGKYSTFIPDKDNILPITDEEYYEDDIVGLFVAFVKKVYGADTLEENLDFIANALGNKGNSSREVIRNYFLNDFFKDHCKTYKKRPIYWLFDSGKGNGFKALVYMHRYDENTIGNLRIDYLHRIQQVYTREIARMQETIDNSTNGREVAAAEKRKEKLTKQLKETKDYDEKISHLALARIAIDLDDGVKVNYEKVQTDAEGNKLAVLAKIG
ncbi:BREX-1 system adenine-specific DNA-methyltransferase PglX [Ruminococcaceae bacterium OttesenSCG-928-I18]|nr:BREX-1 system adenine-specific DNA-methyltransferase PglX [Ruminococcaceae bacterium OttesenSCG-928-I18]